MCIQNVSEAMSFWDIYNINFYIFFIIFVCLTNKIFYLKIFLIFNNELGTRIFFVEHPVQMAHGWVRLFDRVRAHARRQRDAIFNHERAKWNYFVFCRSTKCIRCVNTRVKTRWHFYSNLWRLWKIMHQEGRVRCRSARIFETKHLFRIT